MSTAHSLKRAQKESRDGTDLWQNPLWERENLCHCKQHLLKNLNVSITKIDEITLKTMHKIKACITHYAPNVMVVKIRNHQIRFTSVCACIFKHVFCVVCQYFYGMSSPPAQNIYLEIYARYDEIEEARKTPKHHRVS